MVQVHGQQFHTSWHKFKVRNGGCEVNAMLTELLWVVSEAIEKSPLIHVEE